MTWTVTRKGYIRVTDATTGELISQHVDPDEALESAGNRSPGAESIVTTVKSVKVFDLVLPKVYRKVSDRVAGMCIGSNKNYDDLQYQKAMSRAALVVMGFYPGWKSDVDGSKIRPVLQAIKAMNPKIKLGQYTVLNEARNIVSGDASSDVAIKLNKENWWLRNSAGDMLRWTDAYNAWDINFTEWSKPDAQGQRYTQWRAQRDFEKFFSLMPEFDTWYCDNVMYQPRTPPANWKLDGSDWPSSTLGVGSAYRRGHSAHWAAIRSLHPKVTVFGNANSTMAEVEWKGLLDGAFMEAVIGKSYSIEEWGSWEQAYKKYTDTCANVRSPSLVVLNAHGAPDDYERVRYGLCTVLLGDGMFCYSENGFYDSVPWYDEYDAPLGQPLTPPPKTPITGVAIREYENGIVLVNPSKASNFTYLLKSPHRYMEGLQMGALSGKVVTQVDVPPRSGRLLLRA